MFGVLFGIRVWLTGSSAQPSWKAWAVNCGPLSVRNISLSESPCVRIVVVGSSVKYS